MNRGELCFIKDTFYERFKSCGLLVNKESLDGEKHRRPCCYSFKLENDRNNILWVIPVSSQIDKYQKEYKKSMDKYGICDNVSFGYILGRQVAFLPQNLFPVTEEYISNIYIDKNTDLPVKIQDRLCSELNAKARKKIRYNQRGKPFGMSDVVAIYDELVNEIKEKDNED